MNWSDLGKKVADYAPLLGTVLGGPSGTAVGALISKQFGTETKPADIAKAIDADPNAALKLREVESNNETLLHQIEVRDKQHARDSFKDSRMPAVLSVALTLMIGLIVYLLFYVEVAPGAKDVLFVLLGYVAKEWGGAMQYWFGTTRSSSEKTKLLSFTKL